MIVYIIKQDDGGQWGVCREQSVLFRGMRLGPAIRLARDVARDEHHRSNRPICVEMHEGASRTNLALYPKRADSPKQWNESALSVY